MNKELEEIVGSGKLTGSVREETTAVSDTMSESFSQLFCAAEWETESQWKNVSIALQGLDYLKGTCTTPSCEKWHPPECMFYKSENGCRFWEKCSYARRQVDE